mgnify:FL=1
MKLYNNLTKDVYGKVKSLKEINEFLPYDMERQVALDNLGKQEDIIYKWWRTGV